MKPARLPLTFTRGNPYALELRFADSQAAYTFASQIRDTEADYDAAPAATFSVDMSRAGTLTEGTYYPVVLQLTGIQTQALLPGTNYAYDIERDEIAYIAGPVNVRQDQTRPTP